MALYSSSQVSVGTTPARLDSGTGNRSILIKSTGTIFIGGADVSTANGFALEAGEVFEDRVTGGGGIYARSETGSVNCYVLQRG